MPNLKKYVEIKYDDKVIFVAAIKEGESTVFLTEKENAIKNLENFLIANDNRFKGLEKQIADLEKEIKHLKGED
jgi:chaperonin cofactor prefoldin